MDVKGLLSLEREWQDRRAHDGGKEQAIRDAFAVTPTAYYQRLNAVIETDEALALDAVTTYRLRRLRDRALRSRAARV